MITDVYYQRGFPDPIFEREFVMDIVRQFVPGAEKVTDIDETGGEARTYAVDNNIILKVQRPQQLRLSTSLEREAFFLRQLENIEGVIVPKVLGYGKQDTIEYTCMTRMPGLAVRYSNISGEQREKMLFELGKMLFLIHSVDIKPFLDSGFFSDIDKSVHDVKERLKANFDWGLQRLSDKLSQAEIDKANASAAEELSKITEARIVPIHANPSSTHTFVKSNNRFSGLIDFGDAYISHPICDMRRWGLSERQPLYEGYMSWGKSTKDIAVVYEATAEMERILENLNK
ncbi:MAG: aminoglycoside phosphotransferase family protein [Oscillospiraceae bacterium]|nr:aminoglycoside phosphotransferase family protein [Oscillospiraceae bacterium]